jgi:putative heme-binding domain-containing protein
MMANNAQWIGFSLEIGPDGAMYVLDWHDGDICGNGVLHQETGRVYRIAPTTSLAEEWKGRYSDLRQMTDAQLVELQTSRSDWHARRARVILQHRASMRALKPDTHAQLRRMFTANGNPDWRLRAMWALHVTGGFTPDALVAALSDTDEHVRAWAIQLLCEERSPSARALETFTRMAREDSSAVVRLYLAAALQRIDAAQRWSIAEELMMRAEDADDHNLPKMLWLGIEPLVAQAPAPALERAGRSGIPLVSRFVARRVVDSEAPDALESLVAEIARAPKMQVSLLEGMRDGLESRVELSVPSNWAAAYERLQRADGRVARLAEEVAQQFGGTEAARRSLATVLDRATPLEQRRAGLHALSRQRRPELARELPGLIDDPTFRVDAVRAIAAYDDPALGKLLIARYGSFSRAEKAEALQTLSSRPRYGRLLTDALAADAVPRTDIPPYVSRQLLRVVGTRFTEVWGPIERSVTEDRAFAKYRRILRDDAVQAADARNGRAVFQRTCGACHALYGEGGTIGPDLTGSNRGNLDYLLLNVLDPNGEVQDAYKMTVVTTRDGRTYSGTVASETDRQLTLRVIGRDAVSITKSDIQSREVTAVSMMPPGLFDALTDPEVLDLVAYLRTVKPLEN